MSINIPAIRAHVRELPASKLQALHKTVNDPAQLKAIAKEEGRTEAEAGRILELVNAEYTRRFTTRA